MDGVIDYTNNLNYGWKITWEKRRGNFGALFIIGKGRIAPGVRIWMKEGEKMGE